MPDNEVKVRVTGEDRLSPEVDKAKNSVSAFDGTLKRVGEVASGFLAANVIAGAFDRFTGFIGGSIDLAAEFEQSIGAVESVFKDSAPAIFEWGKVAAEVAGLSENQFNTLAATTGAFLKNFGYDMDTVTGTTVELTQRAADMAAMFGGPVDEAMAAIQAGLRGQQDPLERYGVSLTAAKVEAHALAMTGKDLGKELTDQEKMTARLDLILRQTADAAGQFAREQDTAAGKAAILAAKQENMATQLGDTLLPLQVRWTEAQLKFVETLSTHVIPRIDDLASHLSFIGDSTDESIANVAQLGGELLDLANTVRENLAPLNLFLDLVERGNDLINQMGDDSGDTKEDIDLMRIAFDAAQRQLNPLNTAIEYGNTVLGFLNDRIDDTNEKMPVAAGNADAYAWELDFLEDHIITTKDATVDLTRETNYLNDAFKDLSSQQAISQEAMRLFELGYNDVETAMQHLSTEALEQIGILKNQEGLLGDLHRAIDGATPSVYELARAYQQLKQSIVIAPGLDASTAASANDFLRMHGYDDGGVVPGPIGAPQIALVHGGETIIPTHKSGGFATAALRGGSGIGGATVVNNYITVTAPNYLGPEEALAEPVMRVLTQGVRTGALSDGILN